MSSAVLIAILLLTHAILAAWVSGHALLNKRDPRAAWAWMLASWLVPAGGGLFYWWFGINRLERRARRELGRPAIPRDVLLSDPVPDVPLDKQEEVIELVRLGRALSGRELLAGNDIRVLHDGDEAYPEMLDAIRGARHCVWLTSYIFDDGAVGRAFTEALAAARARDIDVRVLLDGIGDRASGTTGSRLLQSHGVPVRLFMPLRLFPPLLHVNLRNHRKLLCVDGEVAFVGGINIGDHHVMRRSRRAPAARTPASDLHFRLAGPVAGQLAALFADDWHAVAGEALLMPAGTDGRGSAMCRAMPSGPNEDLDRLPLLLQGALANAHRSVQIMTPYFVPTPEISSALQAAAMRGIEVSIVLPEHSDHPWLDAAARRAVAHLLQRRVQVHLRPAPFAHSKMIVVDDYYALVGSANLDARSLRLNFELMVEVYDAAFVATLRRHFEGVRVTCRRLQGADLRVLPLSRRLADALCWLFSPYL